MPLCHVRYRIYPHSQNLNIGGPGLLDVLAEEEREPDEWGEPGRILKRRWLRATDRWGQDHTDDLNSRRYRVYSEPEPIGPVVWLDASDE